MIFTETKIKGAFIVDLELQRDIRGFFARTFCIEEFKARSLKPTIAQCNLSFNYNKGTLRGMHYQKPPSQETKLVRCIQGAIYDVIIDLRLESPSYLSHIGVELTAENRLALYIPDSVLMVSKHSPTKPKLLIKWVTSTPQNVHLAIVMMTQLLVLNGRYQ